MIWTDFFMQPLESHGAAWSREVESNARQMILNGRRSSLHQYELESYAAIGRWVTSYLSGLGYATFTVGAAGDLRALRVFSHE